MAFYAFRLLSPVMQFYWVLKHDIFLAQRPGSRVRGGRARELGVVAVLDLQPIGMADAKASVAIAY